MDKKTIQHQIDCKEASIVALAAFADSVAGEIANLKAQLADADKPELRHWDLGIDDEGRGFVVLSQATLPGSPKAFFSDGDGLINVDERMSPATRVGTLKKVFDGLKAMAEDLERFDMPGSGCTSPSKIQAQLENRNGGIASICTGGPWCWLTLDELTELILNLRRMEATQKRKQNGNTH